MPNSGKSLVNYRDLMVRNGFLVKYGGLLFIMFVSTKNDCQEICFLKKEYYLLIVIPEYMTRKYDKFYSIHQDIFDIIK